MAGVDVSHKPADYLELGPNCPPDDVAPTCNECPEREECSYADRDL